MYVILDVEKYAFYLKIFEYYSLFWAQDYTNISFKTWNTHGIEKRVFSVELYYTRGMCVFLVYYLLKITNIKEKK